MVKRVFFWVNTIETKPPAGTTVLGWYQGRPVLVYLTNGCWYAYDFRLQNPLIGALGCIEHWTYLLEPPI
jgi:hypothetical protein